MALAPGSRLGPYDVLAKLGEGGMGEVYRARDTKLNRDVALKVLPEAFAFEGDRVARFRREAQVLASLNHPNIAAIFGFEDSGSTHALVLELVEGPTLADRIARGPIPLDEALPIAKQIADALEAAHEQGIIHRDLKPANIKLRPDGTVKVLDFGLAKALEPASAMSPMMTAAPTITTPAQMTGVGMILGTAAYMSPEQARGRPADKRSDVWAFGCVLYEMLTGRRVFEAEEISDTLAAVLRADPDWTALPSTTTLSVRRMLRRCLEKDRRKRLADIADARLDLEEPTADGTSLKNPSRRESSAVGWKKTTIIAASSAVIAAAAATAALLSRPGPQRPPVRFQIEAPEKTVFNMGATQAANPVISPDGRYVAFTARTNDLNSQIWIRSLDSASARALSGTDGAQSVFWSPDSRFIAFVANGRLSKVAIAGGLPQTLCECGGTRGGAWSDAGVIVLNGGPRAQYSLLRVAAAGGAASPLLRTGFAHAADFVNPWFLPGGAHLLVRVNSNAADLSGIYAVTVDTGDAKKIIAADSGAVFERQSGHLLFVRRGTLFAQSFNPRTLALSGEAFPVAENISVNRDYLGFTASDDGTLVYGSSPSTGAGLMSWFDRKGNPLGTLGPAGTHIGVEISPDGSRVASHQHVDDGGDIWITDVARGTTSRFTFDASQDNSSPIWSPDGTRLAFASLRNGKWGIYSKDATSAADEQRLMESDAVLAPMSWAPDGRSLVYWSRASGTNMDLSLLSLSPKATSASLLNTPFDESHGQVSPNGRWLAYESNETGRREIYVRPFPSGAGKWQVSTSGGTAPRWRRDGRELFYESANFGGMLHAVETRTDGGEFRAGTPQDLFDVFAAGYVVPFNHISNWHNYAVSADGQRILIPREDPATRVSRQPSITVLLNWVGAFAK